MRGFVANVAQLLPTTGNRKLRNSARSRGLVYQDLEQRNLLASIVFNATNGFVTITGDAVAETATVELSTPTMVNVSLTGLTSQEFALADVTKVRFFGNDGNDIFVNSTAIPSLVYGGTGNDTITGGSSADQLMGEAGDDLINGSDGADFISGGDGIDTLNGNDGNDVIRGGNDNDLINGNGGADRLQGESGNDTIRGNAGNDFIDGNVGDDDLGGGDGNDSILGSEGADRIEGNSGDDVLLGRAGNDILIGGLGSDRIFGETGDDYLDGGDDNDFLLGQAGNDTIFGRHGMDTAYGGADNDQMFGGDDGDTLGGNEGDDTIHGQNGNDSIYGSTGDDTIRGGAGDDVLYGQQDNDILFGDFGNDLLNGGAGNDELHGGSQNDRLFGTDGNDDLYGESGSDILVGGAGNDGLVGGIGGNNTVYGNEGKDRYLFVAGTDNVVDKETQDARLEFRDGQNSSWTNREIEVIDKGLKLLHDRTMNTRLLKGTFTFEPIVFLKGFTSPNPGRIGGNQLLSVTTGTLVPFTRLERQITIGNWDETDAAANAIISAEVPSEMAYTWAGPDAVKNVLPTFTPFWSEFLVFSGWTQTLPTPINFYSVSGDNQWWHLNSAEFAQDFGKLNPETDWATAWRLYFEPNSTSDQIRLVNKMNHIDTLFEALEIW